MLARRVLMTAGTPGHMYFVDRQEKCLKEKVVNSCMCIEGINVS